MPLLELAQAHGTCRGRALSGFLFYFEVCFALHSCISAEQMVDSVSVFECQEQERGLPVVCCAGIGGSLEFCPQITTIQIRSARRKKALKKGQERKMSKERYRAITSMPNVQ